MRTSPDADRRPIPHADARARPIRRPDVHARPAGERGAGPTPHRHRRRSRRQGGGLRRRRSQRRDRALARAGDGRRAGAARARSRAQRRRGHDRGGEAAGPAGRQRTRAAGLRDPPRHRRRDDALVGDRSRSGRRDVRGPRARRGGAHRRTPRQGRRSPGEPVHRPARHQVQHPARRAHAQLLRRLHVGPGQHPRDVGHGVLDALPRRDGAAPLQRALAVEPQPVPVAGEGAGVPEGGARRRQAQDRRDVRRRPTRAATCTTRPGRSRRSRR